MFKVENKGCKVVLAFTEKIMLSSDPYWWTLSHNPNKSAGPKAGVPAGGDAGPGCCGQNSNVSLDNHNRANKMPPHFSLQSKRKAITHKNEWPGKGPGLSRLRVHELQLCAGGHPAPVASLGLHLVLDGADWVHPTEQVSRSHMGRVHKVCRLSDHTSVYPPASFRLRLLCNTAVETQPEFTHAYSPRCKWAPIKFPNLSLGSFTKHTPQYDQGPMMPE